MQTGPLRMLMRPVVLQLLPMQTARMEEGSKIYFEGKNLLELSDDKIRSIRGSDISMIFQEPMTSLNPVYTTGNQVIEAIMLHQQVSHQEAEAKTIELFREVGIPDPCQGERSGSGADRGREASDVTQTQTQPRCLS